MVTVLKTVVVAVVVQVVAVVPVVIVGTIEVVPPAISLSVGTGYRWT